MDQLLPKRNLPAVLSLFFVAPFVAEYLLGDLPLRLLPVLLILAPMYGGGAVLIRELARRTGRGWPSILILGMAYTLVEEGFVSQSLFNPDYLHMHLHLLQPAYLPALGIGAWWTVFMLNLHTFWSISVSIALVEALFPNQRSSPWLGRVGDSVVAMIFILGLAANAAIGLKQNHFVASYLQFLGAGAACILLLVLAFQVRLGSGLLVSGTVPRPWLLAILGFVGGMAVLQTPPRWGWGAVAIILALDVFFLVSLTLLSRRSGWTSLHTLSLGAAGAIAYGLHAFLQKPLLQGSLVTARVGNAIFLAVALVLIALAAKRTAQSEAITPAV